MQQPSFRMPAAAIALLLTLAACTSAAPQAPASIAGATAGANPVSTATSTAMPTTVPATTGADDGRTWIVYKDGTSLHVARPDGSGDHVPFGLIPGGSEVHPDWSPDGSRLALTMRGETDVIWIGNLDGSDARLVADCQDPCAWADEAAWSPDGSSLVFQRMVSKAGVGVSTLEILDVATGRARVVLTAASGRSFYQPRWSPDGSQVVLEYARRASPAFDSDVVGVALAIVEVAATHPVAHEITAVADLTNSPDWSWATDRILFVKPTTAAGFDGPMDIMSMRPDGTDARVVISVDSRDGRPPTPAWMPDGLHVLFVQADGAIAIVSVDGMSIQTTPLEDRERNPHPHAIRLPA